MQFEDAELKTKCVHGIPGIMCGFQAPIYCINVSYGPEGRFPQFGESRRSDEMCITNTWFPFHIKDHIR